MGAKDGDSRFLRMRYPGFRQREIVPEIFYGDGGTWAVNLFSGPRPLGCLWRDVTWS